MFLFEAKYSRGFPGTLISSITVVIYTLSFCFCHFNSDRSVLIEFKNSVVDKHGILSSWNFDFDHCSWQGVFCDANSAVRAVMITGSSNTKGSISTSAISKCNFSRFQLYGSGRGLKASSSYLNGSISGRLLPMIGMLTELRVLSLPFNEFSGQIPKDIWSLRKLEVLDLEGNILTGRIPNDISRLRKLRVLNLGFNRFVGEIPFLISKCVTLQVLSLACNLMNGSIPESIGELGSIVLLDLSWNNFHGHVPNDSKFVKNHVHLCLDGNGEGGTAVNQILTRTLLSYEDWINSSSLVNSLPVSSSNSGAGYSEDMTIAESPSVGASAHVKNGISSIAMAGIISASAIVSVLLALIILFFYTRKRMPKSSFQVAGLREIIQFSDLGVPLTFDIVVQATANFSTSYCIGHGGFGSTYKVEVSDGVFLAVKRLSVGKYLQGVKQFHAEIKTLGRIRHPNLVTLVGYHASQMEMFLVYNHLPGGNLEKFIKERSERGIDWMILYKIALGIASAIAFLHDECVPRILHRDIKPSNILLDNEFNAYLSDFGLSRLLGNSETHATTGVAGTFGYVAPEYAMTCRVSEKSDVYSYGVVLLELISDKKVLDPSFSSHGNGFNIVSWACMLVREGRGKDAFAAGLWEMGPRDKLVAALNLGVACTVEALSVRPTMKQAVHRLKQLQS